MNDIPSPCLPADDPDRIIEAQEALQDAFTALRNAAVSAGWTDAEADTALHCLALANALAEDGALTPEAACARAITIVGQP